MVDLNKIQEKIDKLLDGETSESMRKWLLNNTDTEK